MRNRPLVWLALVAPLSSAAPIGVKDELFGPPPADAPIGDTPGQTRRRQDATEWALSVDEALARISTRCADDPEFAARTTRAVEAWRARHAARLQAAHAYTERRFAALAEDSGADAAATARRQLRHDIDVYAAGAIELFFVPGSDFRKTPPLRGCEAFADIVENTDGAFAFDSHPHHATPLRELMHADSPIACDASPCTPDALRRLTRWYGCPRADDATEDDAVWSALTSGRYTILERELDIAAGERTHGFVLLTDDGMRLYAEIAEADGQCRVWTAGRLVD